MHIPRAPRRRTALLLLAPAVALLAAACGSSASPAPASPSASPSSAASSAAPSPSAAAPQAIVSLSPTATEMLFAIGAGSQVTAVDDNSTYPANAPKTKLSGFQPNAEAVIGYKPDLVVISNDANGLTAALTKVKIPVLALPAAATLDEAYAQITKLGTATGHTAEADKLIATTKERIAAAVALAPPATKGKKVYHEVDQTGYSATSSTFIGSVYTLFGLVNIADKAADAASSGGYPKLSPEFVVKAAPDLIVLADTKCCQQSAAALAKRPGFAGIPAVKNGAVLAGDDDVASRWGPRVADFAEEVAKELKNLG